MKWNEKGTLPSGSRFWESRDGMFRIVASEFAYGVSLPRVWKLWEWRHGGWNPVAESRSRKRVEKLAKQRAKEIDSDE